MARYLIADDACNDKATTTRLRPFATDAVVGPKIVDIQILMWKTFLSIAAIVRRGVAHLVTMYYSPIGFVGAV